MDPGLGTGRCSLSSHDFLLEGRPVHPRKETSRQELAMLCSKDGEIFEAFDKPELFLALDDFCLDWS